MLNILEQLKAGDISLNQAKELVKKEMARNAASIPHKCLDNYKIVRTYSAGVFAGFVESRSADGRNIVLTGARRLWYWSGAASLSQLAVSGVSKPKECKFPVEVPKVELTEVVEILDVTPEAKASIDGVEVWSA